LLNRQNPYPEVPKAKGKHERLLAYVQKNPLLIQSYQDVLLPRYEDEVFSLYKTIILEDGQKSDSRKDYKILASWLMELVCIGGSFVATGCLEVLSPRYMKRPAMRDQIQQVGLLLDDRTERIEYVGERVVARSGRKKRILNYLLVMNPVHQAVERITALDEVYTSSNFSSLRTGLE